MSITMTTSKLSLDEFRAEVASCLDDPHFGLACGLAKRFIRTADEHGVMSVKPDDLLWAIAQCRAGSDRAEAAERRACWVNGLGDSPKSRKGPPASCRSKRAARSEADKALRADSRGSSSGGGAKRRKK